MTRFAYFDCFSGISGDMTLGALIDLGAETAEIESAVRSMGLPKLSIRSKDVQKCGFRAVSVQIDHPPEHAHRHLHHITEMIDSASEIETDAKELAKRIFLHVAIAEAKVHGTTLEKVHFHEVGAIDSIADIVGTAVAICHLRIKSATASHVPTGTGSINIDHGNVAVPAPATAEILRGIPIAPTSIAKELTTPTGAAILKELCHDFGPIPAMTIDAIGYGAGTRDLPNQPNLLRLMMGTRSEHEESSVHAHTHHDTVVVLETNLDDATGEQIADCADRLMNAGALDVTQTPCMMKKGRTGIVLTVITRNDQIAAMEEIIFRHTSSIGIRRHVADRDILPREAVTIDTPMGKIAAKSVTLPGGKERIKVEDTEARRMATEFSLSTQEIQRIAEQNSGRA